MEEIDMSVQLKLYLSFRYKKTLNRLLLFTPENIAPSGYIHLTPSEPF